MSEKLKPEFKTATPKEVEGLQKLSTERLIIWIIGKSKDMNLKLSVEDIVIESWKLNPEKHSLRGYNKYPDSHSVIKRIGEMKGKKGLLIGSEMTGYSLTEISQSIFLDLKILVKHGKIKQSHGNKVADRNISSIDEAPYRRLTKSPAYVKYLANKSNEIVETDFLYFYGINWHSKPSIVQNRIKNVDAVVKSFKEKDSILKNVHSLINENFNYVKEKLLKGN